MRGRSCETAGARSVAVTSIAGHFCIEAFKAVSPPPMLVLQDGMRCQTLQGLAFRPPHVTGYGFDFRFTQRLILKFSTKLSSQDGTRSHTLQGR